MAHQRDLHVVQQNFEGENPGEEVQDPVCGMTLERAASKHIVFRPSETIYFCSRECKDRFLSPTYRSKTA